MLDDFMKAEMIDIFENWVRKQLSEYCYDWKVEASALRKLSDLFNIHFEECSSKEETLKLKKELAAKWQQSSTAQKLSLAKWIVKDWGKVNSTKIEEYVEAIINREEIGFLGISSWSKIISISQPNENAIYDSRVSAALIAVQLLHKVKQGVIFKQIKSRNGSISPFQDLFPHRKLEKEMGWIAIPENKTYKTYTELLSVIAERIGEVSIAEIEMLLFSEAPKLCSEIAGKSVRPLLERMKEEYTHGSFLGGEIGIHLSASAPDPLISKAGLIGVLHQDPFEDTFRTFQKEHYCDYESISASAYAFLLSQLGAKTLPEAISSTLQKTANKEGELDNQSRMSEVFKKAFSIAKTKDKLPSNLLPEFQDNTPIAEAMAISIICSLKSASFEDGLSMAVNYGSHNSNIPNMTGNILGAVYGSSVLPKRLTQKIKFPHSLGSVDKVLYPNPN
ncbi:ADP-ribosylglycohydrolase family protein [Terasakiella sp. A23]|uniref:ADP-ribosylglycohydrolase family protein n=1 Tax=Terasakiella sp. FCG-A23 TaxID=3080561 RepID=UPI0029558BF3|nr:ADP-ribosylglycohydrolase family protein [Terasakiella sp. A23]MDV7341798.1 ADP-ribosylglycohydrolase family protein [Terasakiella sp. A23]